jgi:hypothetical protein
MKRLRIVEVGVLLALIAIAFQNCSQQNFSGEGDRGGGEGAKVTLETLQRAKLMEDEIRQTTSDKRCLADTDCRAIGFGHKPCGGPVSYLIYSIQSTNEEQLGLMVSVYNQNQAELHEQSGFVGTCEYLMPPTLRCVENQCVPQLNEAQPVEETQ